MWWEIVVAQQRDEKKPISIIRVVIDIITEETTLLRPWDLCTALGAGKWKRLRRERHTWFMLGAMIRIVFYRCVVLGKTLLRSDGA